MTRGIMYLPSLEEYAKFKRFKNDYHNLETLYCSQCRYCREGVNACIFGNQVRNLDTLDYCPRTSRFS